MTKIADMPVRGAVPTGGYIVISEPIGVGNPLSTFAKVAVGAVGGTGTVTNIATTGPGISGGPITGTGTLAVQWNAGVVSSLSGLTLSSGVLTAPALPANNADYVVGVTQPGVTGNAQKLLVHKLPHAITLPASLAGSSATALTAATASTAFVLAYVRSGSTTTIGTFTFAAAGTVATISGVVIPTLAAGDVLTITGPATADATLADIGISILGAKV